MKINREKHRFVVKESANGEPFIAIEPLQTKERTVNFYLAPGSNYDAVQAVARYLNENVASLGFAE